MYETKHELVRALIYKVFPEISGYLLGVYIILRYLDSLNLAQKCARIFVGGYYLFWEANSFPREKSDENCQLREHYEFDNTVVSCSWNHL